MDLKAKYEKAIKKFIDSIKEDREIIGILVCGSFVTNDLDENSDVDIHLVLNDECEYRERGNTWVDGVEIEYFKNPPKQIRSYFKKETASPHTANMFLHSQVKYKKSKIIDSLIEEAKKIIEEKPNKIKAFEIELLKYHIDDIFKDLKDCLAKKDKIHFRFVKNRLLDQLIDAICKIRRIRKTKEKRLLNQLRVVDEKFAELLSKTQEEDVLEIEEITKLVEHTEKYLGGKRSVEWKLRSNLDL